MTMRQVVKLLRKYPYLLNDTFIRSHSEAQSIYVEGFLSLSNVVARAKEQSGLPKEEWAYFEKSVAAAEQKEHKKKERKEWISERTLRIAAHKRTAIACTVLAVILAFFTLFPTGRALAKAMFDYVLNIFGYRIEIVDREYSTYENGEILPAESNTGITRSTIEYDDITEFYKATGLTPYVLDLEGWDCTVIIEKNSETTGKSLRTEYQTDDEDDDGVIVVMQKWLLNTQSDIWSNGGFSNSIILANENELYFSIDVVDGSLDGVCLLEDSVLQIHVNKEPYISQLLSALQK